MTEIESQQPNTPDTPPTGLKSLGNSFWWLVVVLAIYGFGRSLIGVGIETAAKQAGAGYKDILIPIVAILAMLGLGSLVDWLGLKRSARLLVAILLGISLVAAASIGLSQANSDPIRVLPLLLLAIPGGLLMAVKYRALRRYLSRENFVRGLLILMVLTEYLSGGVGYVVGTLPLDIYESVDESNAFYTWMMGLAALIAFVVLVLLWKWPLQDVQLDGARPPRPAGPFAGLAEILKSPQLKPILVLVGCYVLLGNISWGPSLLMKYPPEMPLGLMVGIPITVEIVALLFFIPIIGRLAARHVFAVGAIGIVAAPVALLLPFSGWTLAGVAIACFSFTEFAMTLMLIFLWDYILLRTPKGREGSMAAVVGAVLLLIGQARYYYKEFTFSQIDADWLVAIRDAVNPDVANPELFGAQMLWLLLLVPVALGAGLLFAFRRYIFESAPLPETDKTTPLPR